jgi:hypothetical protein
MIALVFLIAVLLLMIGAVFYIFVINKPDKQKIIMTRLPEETEMQIE